MERTLSQIDNLYQKWQSLKPLQKKNEDRLWEKFRLEWNYNSNHIEGNTLTYGDTQLLLRLGDDFKAKEHSLRDVEEMRAHDLAIFMLRDWTQATDRPLLERDIRELNEVILVRPFWADATTSDGQATRRKITPGQYKEFPNHVQLKSGEIFRYAEPNEVAPKMQELLDWYNHEQEVHSVITAAFLHYKFVCIHPFDDGNGRVSRLLMNYHLMKCGYPPIIIKSADKSNYLYALNQADTGNEQAFIEYIAQQLVWSLELSIKAAKGENIEEREDLYKEIEVWKKEVKGKWPQTPRRSVEAISKIYENTIKNINKKLKDRSLVFKELFYSTNQQTTAKAGNREAFYSFPTSYYKHEYNALEKIRLSIQLNKPRYENREPVTTSIHEYISINFEVFEYSIWIHDNMLISKNYAQELTEAEIEFIVNEFMKVLFEKVKQVME